MSSDPKRMLEQERKRPLPHNPQVRPLFKLLRDDAIRRLEESSKLRLRKRMPAREISVDVSGASSLTAPLTPTLTAALTPALTAALTKVS